MEGEYDDDGNVPKRWNTILDTNNRNIDPYFSRRAAREEALILGGNLYFSIPLCHPLSSILGGKGRTECAEEPKFLARAHRKCADDAS